MKKLLFVLIGTISLIACGPSETEEAALAKEADEIIDKLFQDFEEETISNEKELMVNEEDSILQEIEE